MSITSPSARARGARSQRSLSDTMQPSAPWATWLFGAAASQMFIAPHSSASTWPNVIQRSDSTGTTLAIASATSGNRPRAPVWKMSGSSPTTRNWLNVKPTGVTSGTQVEMRKMPSLISSMVVVNGSMPRRRSVAAAAVQSGLNDPAQVTFDRGVRAVQPGPDVAIQRRTRLGKRLGELGDRRPDGTRDVEPRPLGGGGGAPVAAAEAERRRELGDELVELFLDRFRAFEHAGLDRLVGL